MPDAYEALDKCMDEEQGQLVGGTTLLLGIFAMVFIESMVGGPACASDGPSLVQAGLMKGRIISTGAVVVP